MPPGPVGVPLLGNKHQMPAVKPWVKFAELNKTYGTFKIAQISVELIYVIRASGFITFW